MRTKSSFEFDPLIIGGVFVAIVIIFLFKGCIDFFSDMQKDTERYLSNEGKRLIIHGDTLKILFVNSTEYTYGLENGSEIKCYVADKYKIID